MIHIPKNFTLWWTNIKIFCIWFGRFLCSFRRFRCRVLILKWILCYIHQVFSLSNFGRVKPKKWKNTNFKNWSFQTFELFSIIIHAQKSKVKLDSTLNWKFSKQINPSGNIFMIPLSGKNWVRVTTFWSRWSVW